MKKEEVKITVEQEIQEYLDKYSDFSFELKIMRDVAGCGFDVQHSGTYQDGITKKTREFDLRAWRWLRKKRAKALLAIECKNLIRPLIVHSVERSVEESFQEIIVMLATPPKDHGLIPSMLRKRFDLHRVAGAGCIYKIDGYVGKGMDQLLPKPSDAAVFDKMSQALSSCEAMLPDYQDEPDDKLIVMLPIIVIPDQMLWEVRYSKNGDVLSQKRTNMISYWVDKDISQGDVTGSYMKISHLEIVTQTGLKELLNSYFPTDETKIDILEHAIRNS